MAIHDRNLTMGYIDHESGKAALAGLTDGMGKQEVGKETKNSLPPFDWTKSFSCDKPSILKQPAANEMFDEDTGNTAVMNFKLLHDN